MQAHFGGADKGDAPDIGMGQQDLSLITGTGNDVEYTVGNTGFLIKLSDLHTGHGSGGSGLQHEGIAETIASGAIQPTGIIAGKFQGAMPAKTPRGSR